MILTTAALCMAINIYHEARSETIPGQYAVALVTMNRAGGDPKKVCDVVLAKRQFSWTRRLVKGNTLARAGLPLDDWAWNRAQIVARVTLSGRFYDLTNGATFYHTKSVHPAWRTAFVPVKTIGKHVFYRHIA